MSSATPCSWATPFYARLRHGADPGGSAEDLPVDPAVVRAPDETRVFTAHDYKAPGRDAAQHQLSAKARNVHVGNGQDMATFVQMREERDAKPGCRA